MGGSSCSEGIRLSRSIEQRTSRQTAVMPDFFTLPPCRLGIAVLVLCVLIACAILSHVNLSRLRG